MFRFFQDLFGPFQADHFDVAQHGTDAEANGLCHARWAVRKFQDFTGIGGLFLTS